MSESKIEQVELEELESKPQGQSLSIKDPLALVKDVKIRLNVTLGEADLSIGELTSLKEQAIVTLDKNLDEPVELVFEGKVVARGVLVAVDDSFGVQLTDVSKP